MKYFKEREEKVLLSTYVKELEGKKDIIQDELDYLRGKHILELFGDVELERSLIKEFISTYSKFGGRYSVRSEDETLTSLLEMSITYDLSSSAIEELQRYYIKDLFDEYSLKKVLQDFIDTYGMTDKAFTEYLELVDKLGELYQEQFIKEAEEVESLKEEYGQGLVDYLKHLILRKHIHKDELLKYLPESELIKKDHEQLLDIATKSRIYFGMCYPKSYTLIEDMTKDETLSDTEEEFYYYVSTSKKQIPLTFTKTEFLESIKKKQKIK